MARMKVSKLISESVMYSVNKDSGEVVTHHLPWAKGSEELDNYTAKGFTFERPLTVDVLKKAQTMLDEVDVYDTITYDKGTHILSQKPKRKYRKKVRR